MSMLAIALLAATVGNGAAAFEVPAGWSHTEANGVVVLTPNDLKQGETFVIELHPNETASGSKAWLDTAWSALKKSYKDVQEQPVNVASPSPGEEMGSVSGVMHDAKGGTLLLTLTAVLHAGRVVPILTVASSAEVMQAHVNDATKILTSIRFAMAMPAAAKTTFASRAHVFSGGAPSASAATQPASGGKTLDSKTITGAWGSTSTTGYTFYNPGTGEWGQPVGNGMTLTFRADGTYDKASYLATGSFSCSAKSFFWESGSWKLDGTTLTLAQKTAKQRLVNCGSPAKDLSVAPSTTKHAVRLARDPYSGDPVLFVMEPEGEQSYPRLGASGSGTVDADFLVGDWQIGGFPVKNLYNEAAGAWGPELGTQQAFHFNADGTYSQAGIVPKSDPMCATVFHYFESGRWKLEGGTLSLTPAKARVRNTTCRGDGVSDAAAKASSTPLTSDKDPLTGFARITVFGQTYLRINPN